MPASEPHSAGRRQRRRRASLLRLQPRRRQRVHRSASLRNTTGNPPRREQPGVPACSQAPSPSPVPAIGAASGRASTATGEQRSKDRRVTEGRLGAESLAWRL